MLEEGSEHAHEAATELLAQSASPADVVITHSSSCRSGEPQARCQVAMRSSMVAMTLWTWAWFSTCSACCKSAQIFGARAYLKSSQIRVKVIPDEVEAILHAIREVLVQLAELAFRLQKREGSSDIGGHT